MKRSPLRRNKPLRSSGQPEARTEPARDPDNARAWRQRSKRLSPRNAKRAAERRERDFGDDARVAAIKRMRCMCTRAPKRHPECTGGYSEPSHVRHSRGAGGTNDDIGPHSSGCHRAWHQHGLETYLAAIGWTDDDLEAELARVNAWLEGADSMPA
jgi:hypothetical protein